MEVSGLITHDLELHFPVPQAVVAQRLHALLQRLPRWLVVVEEIARKQYHVHLHSRPHRIRRTVYSRVLW